MRIAAWRPASIRAAPLCMRSHRDPVLGLPAALLTFPGQCHVLHV